MKVKNIMFSGFAAAILMGVAAEANAASRIVASKGYVDAVAGSLEALTTTADDNLVAAINELNTNKLGAVEAEGEALEAGEYYKSVTQATDGQITVEIDTLATSITASEQKAPTTAAVHAAIQNTVDGLDVAAVGQAGQYIQVVSQANGEVSATPQGFDQTVGEGATNNNAPTTLAVYNAIQNVNTTVTELDLEEVGENGSYIKLVSQEDGRVSATPQAFDTTVTQSTSTAPTSKAVHDALALKQNKFDDGQGASTTTGFINSVTQNGGTVTASATQFDTQITADDVNNTSTAPTSAAVYNAIQAIPVMPLACNATGVVCVLTSEGGAYEWSVLATPYSAVGDENGETVQDQTMPASTRTEQQQG